MKAEGRENQMEYFVNDTCLDCRSKRIHNFISLNSSTDLHHNFLGCECAAKLLRIAGTKKKRKLNKFSNVPVVCGIRLARILGSDYNTREGGSTIKQFSYLLINHVHRALWCDIISSDFSWNYKIAHESSSIEYIRAND